MITKTFWLYLFYSPAKAEVHFPKTLVNNRFQVNNAIEEK